MLADVAADCGDASVCAVFNYVIEVACFASPRAVGLACDDPLDTILPCNQSLIDTVLCPCG